MVSKSCRPIWKLLLVTLIAWRGLPAQSPEPQGTPKPFPSEPGIDGPVFGGIALGGLGFVVGGFAGYGVANCPNHGDFCGLGEMFLGAAVGGTLGMATGVHLGNRRRGSLGTDFVVGSAVWGGGIALAATAKFEGNAVWAIFLAIPVAQLIATTNVERSVGRRREQAQTLKVSLIPQPHGFGLAASLPMPRIR